MTRPTSNLFKPIFEPCEWHTRVFVKARSGSGVEVRAAVERVHRRLGIDPTVDTANTRDDFLFVLGKGLLRLRSVEVVVLGVYDEITDEHERLMNEEVGPLGGEWFYESTDEGFTARRCCHESLGYRCPTSRRPEHERQAWLSLAA